MLQDDAPFDEQTLAQLHTYLARLPEPVRLVAWGNPAGNPGEQEAVRLGEYLAASFSAIEFQMRPRRINYAYYPVLGVMGLISCGFILFTLLTSNPFERMFPPPADGRDLNPLLQDPGMVIHPPMLYMGYVGFVVAFAFAVSALLSGRLDAAWALRPCSCSSCPPWVVRRTVLSAPSRSARPAHTGPTPPGRSVVPPTS